MWFKQAQLFKFENKFPYNAKDLTSQLEQLTFTPCPAHLFTSQGWVSPIDRDNAPLVHTIQGFMLICLQIEEKVLPPTIINQKLNEQIKEFESSKERKISIKEKNWLKQGVYNTLLPQAFGKLTRNYALIDIKNNWLILNTNNQKKVENFISFFKRSLNDIKIICPETKKLSPILTRWLLNKNYPETLKIEDACVFYDPQQLRRTISIQHQDLSASYVQAILKNGFEVSQIKMIWNDQVTFVLKNDFTLQSLQYHDSIIELANERPADTNRTNKIKETEEEEKFDADFFIMTGVLTQIFQDFLSVFAKTVNKKA